MSLIRSVSVQKWVWRRNPVALIDTGADRKGVGVGILNVQAVMGSVWMGSRVCVDHGA